MKGQRYIAPDAVQFWNLFSNNFDPQGMRYVNENGELIYSIKQLPKWLQDIVHKKIKQQMGLDDCIGIIFYENSSVSQSIANSLFFINYIIKILKKLTEHRILFKKSYDFNPIDMNNFLTYGKVDLPMIYMDNSQDIWVILMDTYDFNKNSKNPVAKQAYPVQISGLGLGYYTIAIIKLTKQKIFYFLYWYLMNIVKLYQVNNT